MLARTAFRRSWGGLIAIVLVLAIGLGAAVTAIEAADRTVSAYPDYLERNEVADLVVNTVLANERTQEILEGTPGVERVVSDSLLTAAPAEDPEGSSDLLQFRVSQDGRYTEQDRPVVDEGRMVGSGMEVFLTRSAADELDAEVGDVVDVNFYGADPEDPTGAEPGPIVREVSLAVVGIGTFADTVRPDDLFPRMYALVTPEAAGTADCLQIVPQPDDPRSFLELLLAAVPEECAMTYRYYSLEVAGGRDEAAAVAGELADRFRAENERLPQSLREVNAGYFLIPTFTADDARTIRSSLAPVVAALRVFGVAAGLAVLGAVAVLVVRQHRRRVGDLVVLRGLGLGTLSRVVSLVVAPAAAIAVGVTGAAVVAWSASTIGPVASARRVDPHPAHGLGGWAVLALGVGLVLALGAVALASWRVTVRAGVEAGRARRTHWPLGASLPTLGLRAALRGRDAVSAAAGAGVAIAAVVTTVVFAAAVGDVVDEPDRFGWTVDAAFLANYGYGPLEPAADEAGGPPQEETWSVIAADLDRPDVEAWGIAAGLSGDITVNGETVPALAGRAGFDEIAAGFPVVEGKPPTGEAEVALGSTTARDLDLEVGDEVRLGSPYGETEATVAGLVVLPEIGPFQSDRTSLATGVLLPEATVEAVYADAEEETGVTPAALADYSAAVVMVELADGTTGQELLDDLGPLDEWDPTGFGVSFPEPVRAPVIVDLDAVRGAPAGLAALFALGMAGAVVAGLAAGTRARRRELAVVRALGATRRQRRVSVRVHAVTTIVLGLVVGLPVGIAAGRVAFRRLATDMGVADEVTTSLLLVGAVALGALVLAVLAAEVLARRAVVGRPLPDVGATGPPGSP